MNRRRAIVLLLILASATVLGCEREEPGIDLDFDVRFPTGAVRIETDGDTITLGVQVAETESQRRIGLMRRTSLAPDSGMIFLFDQEQAPDDVFWMYNTLIPLDIAFLDQDGRIGNIRAMEPCPSPYPQYCPNYEARVPFWSALEVNRGYFERQGIGIGDRVVLERGETF